MIRSFAKAVSTRDGAKRLVRLSTVGLLAFAVQGCGIGIIQSGDRGATLQTPIAQQLPATQPEPVEDSLSSAQYARAGDFKAVAEVEGGFYGIGNGEQTLVSAEREAIRACTARSSYQGDCDITRVGDRDIRNLDDANAERVRWSYLRTIHDRLSVMKPVQLRLPIKAVVPGSQVVDGNLFLSGDFLSGGYSVIQFADRTCSGALDPIERDADELAEAGETAPPPIGIMEYACDNGRVLRGGYVKADASNQIFFLEDSANERWDFIASTRNDRVGNDFAAFKGLYRSIERGE